MISRHTERPTEKPFSTYRTVFVCAEAEPRPTEKPSGGLDGRHGHDGQYGLDEGLALEPLAQQDEAPMHEPVDYGRRAFEEY